MKLKMRSINYICTMLIVLANVLGLGAVLTGKHTDFSAVMLGVSTALSVLIALRVLIGDAAIRVMEKEKDSELIDICIGQSPSDDVVYQFCRWMINGDSSFMGAKINTLLQVVDDDKNVKGYYITLVGTRKAYEAIKKKMTGATVIDRWPTEDTEWRASRIITDYLGEEKAQKWLQDHDFWQKDSEAEEKEDKADAEPGTHELP